MLTPETPSSHAPEVDPGPRPDRIPAGWAIGAVLAPGLVIFSLPPGAHQVSKCLTQIYGFS